MDNQFASLLPAVENYLKLAEDFHSYLSEGEASGKDFATICTQFDSIRKHLWDVIISHEDNIPENSMQTTYNVSNTWVRNFIATFECTVEDFLNDPATKSLNEAEKRIVLDELFKALIQHLHTWIGDVINTQHMANSNQNNGIEYQGNDRAYFIISKICKELYSPENRSKLYDEKINLPVNVAGKNSKKEINTTIFINIDELKDYGLPDIRLNPFDREVHDAICTLWKSGYNEMSISMIYHVLTGNKKSSNSNLSDEMRDLIDKSILKMMGTIIRINAHAEVEAGYLKKTSIFEAEVIDHVLPARKIKTSVNGHVDVDCIKVYDIPPLYQYAREKKQIANVENIYLKTPLLNTPENIKLRNYFSRIIEALKNPNNHFNNPDVLYKTLEEYLQITAPNKNALHAKRRQLREKVKKLLDYWVDKKYIISYQEIKKGSVPYKIQLHVAKKDKTEL